MKTARLRPEAEADLVDIWVYVAERNVDAADRLSERLEARMVAAAAMPGIGSPRPKLGREVRSLSVGSYLIFYRSADEGIDVLRILHGARDLSRVPFD